MQYIWSLGLLFILLRLYASQDIIVNTKLGQVRGSLMKTRLEKNIFAFRGLLYAEPPVGKLRFKEPVPVKPWSGVFDATEDGPACIQTKGTGLSENCLTLSIYTKQTVDTKLPVIVYLPPGGFFQCSAQSSVFGPKYLLDHNIILVTVNYRLNSLGFINTGDAYATGNYGLKDQVLALKFVRDHISSFGGDPKSVTLTGQSAGARSIVLHMVSPLSKGLFHRAIAMSGSSTTPIPPQREQIEVARKQATLLGCTTDTRVEMFECLKEKPAEEFGKTVKGFLEWNGNPTLVWYPSVESIIPGIQAFLADEPEKLMQRGQIYPVPLIIGVTQDEFAFMATFGIWEALQGNSTYFQELTDNWYELAPICFGYERHTERSRYISEELKKFYFNDEPLTLNNSDSLQALYANALVHFPVYRAASLISQYSPAPVYFYEFTKQGQYSIQKWPDTGKPKGGVAHGDDLQYIFNIESDAYDYPKSFPFYNGSDPEVLWVKRWTSIWASFAQTGDPIPKDPVIFSDVVWQRLRPSDKKYLNLGEEISLESDFQGEAMRLWDRLFP